MSEGNIVQVQSLSASYRNGYVGGKNMGEERKAALRNISLNVAYGEVFGIVGESGSGKSTLVRSLLRLHEPDAGSVQIAGLDVMRLDTEQLRIRLRRVARLMYQHPDSSLNPGMTVRDILLQCTRLHRSDLDDVSALKEILDFLESVGLDGSYLGRWPGGLSGGEKRRIAMCRSLLSRPRVLFADEPTSGLDAATQESFLRVLIRLKEQLKLTVVVISHDLGLIGRICNRVAVMKAGEIVDTLNREQILRRESNHAYVRDLLAAHLKLSDLQAEP